MHAVLPQNEKYVSDVFGSTLGDGVCALEADRQVGCVRLEFGSRLVQVLGGRS